MIKMPDLSVVRECGGYTVHDPPEEARADLIWWFGRIGGPRPHTVRMPLRISTDWHTYLVEFVGPRGEPGQIESGEHPPSTVERLLKVHEY